MNRGTCLCGIFSWEFSGKPESSYHCHCSMCRKAHGATFATYYFVPAERFQWIDQQKSTKEYASSPKIVRDFCEVCGSVVPNLSENRKAYSIPAGSHDTGPPVDCHIFTGSVAPWFEITDDLPRHEYYPPGYEYSVYEQDPPVDPAPGIIRGSCLCGEVRFRVTEPFKAIYNCHCSRCRQARAAAFTTNGFTSDEGVEFTSGEDHIVQYKLPSAEFFTQVFCDICGSGLPRIDPSRKLAVVPMGALDDDPEIKPKCHIYVEDKAEWYPITDDLPCFGQGPK